MPELPRVALVFLVLLTVHQVPLTCRYDICIVRTWAMGYLLVSSVVFLVLFAFCFVSGSTLGAGVSFAGELVLWFYVVWFCLSTPSELPLYSPSEDCMC